MEAHLMTVFPRKSVIESLVSKVCVNSA